jgi:hypothetical protein
MTNQFTRTTFGELPTSTRFKTTPTSTAFEWFKVSTRTARLNGNGRVLYFLAADVVHVDSAHLEEMLGKRLTGGDNV